MKRLFLALVAATATMTTAAAAQSIAGQWDAAMSTPGGVRNFKIDFQVSGDTVTGTVHRSAGDVPLRGTIKGNLLKFSYTIDYNGNDLVLTMTVTVDGDTMKGTVDFGGAAEDEFSAKRAPR
jgi:opacity protein-like surface antigen